MRKTTAQQLARPGLPPPPRALQPNRTSFGLSQNVKPQSISNGNSGIESSHPTPPIRTATPYPRPAITDSKQHPNPHQQRPPSQQAAPRQAAQNRNHKSASNHQPTFVTSLGTTIAYHALKTTQTRLQPAVFRLYCNHRNSRTLAESYLFQLQKRGRYA